MALFDWRSKLQEASFRKVPFFVDGSTTTVGRRNTVHEYPFQDKAYVEDIGGAANRYTITAHVVQQPPLFNYFKARDNLIAALNESGPGNLVHPYLGEKRVAVIGSPSISETFTRGGMASFNITFIETRDNLFPTEAPDLVSALDLSVLSMIESVVDSFAEIYSSAKANIDKINAGLSMIKSSIQRVKNLPSGAVSTAIAFVDNVSTTVAQTLDSPCDLGEALTDAFDLFVTLGQSSVQDITGDCTGRVIEEAFANTVDGVSRAATTTIEPIAGTALIDSVLELNKFGEAPDSEDASSLGGTLEPVTINNNNSAQIAANQAILIDLNRVSGLAQAGKLAVRINYDNREAADAVLEQVTTEIDDLLDYLADETANAEFLTYNVDFSNDDIFSNLNTFKGQFIDSMRRLGATLANIEDYKVPADTQSVLELAYDKYEDLTRADEITTRNLIITHPGFMPNNENIEILSK
jgi:prophage DNA circulation protein